MARTDDDSWDLASSVGATATLVAAGRAMASKDPKGLISDPYADPLVRAVGLDFFTKMIDGELEWLYRQVNLQVSVDIGGIGEQVEEYFSKFRIVERRTVDGLRVVFKDKSWVMFRPSGTEPKTRIYCEARDELRLAELVETARNLVERLAKPAMSAR